MVCRLILAIFILKYIKVKFKQLPNSLWQTSRNLSNVLEAIKAGLPWVSPWWNIFINFSGSWWGRETIVRETKKNYRICLYDYDNIIMFIPVRYIFSQSKTGMKFFMIIENRLGKFLRIFCPKILFVTI